MTNTMRKQFAERFRELRQKYNLSQEEMAEKLDLNQSKVSDWERERSFPHDVDLQRLIAVFGTPAVQQLLSLEAIHSHHGVTWIEYVPSMLSGEQREIVKLGINFFRSIVVNQQDVATIIATPPFSSHPLTNIYQAFKSVLRKGYIHIVSVERNRALEEKIRTLNNESRSFPYLKNIVVAHTSHGMDATIILTELIVHLAMEEVLQNLRGIGAIGVCSGYTLLRLSERIIFNLALFNSIRWIPLMGYPRERVSPYSANHIVLTLASRYGGTAYRMPFTPPKAETKEEEDTESENTKEESETAPLDLQLDLQQEGHIIQEVKNLTLAFVTVNGRGNRSIATNGAHTELRSADYTHLGNKQKLYEILQEKGLEDLFEGEMLGYMLDKDGNPIIAKDFEKDRRSLVNTIPLNLLRTIASENHVWLLAAGDYKAKPTFMALKSGLVNSIVIDTTIAKHLIQRLEEENNST